MSTDNRYKKSLDLIDSQRVAPEKRESEDSHLTFSGGSPPPGGDAPTNGPDSGSSSVQIVSWPVSGVRFDNEKDKLPKPWTGTLPKLFGAQHEVRNIKEGGQAFSFAIYTNGSRRGNEGVKEIMALSFDLDHVSGAALGRVKEDLARHGYAYVMHSTFGHRSGGGDDNCVRLILLLSRPVLPDEYEPFWQIMNGKLGGLADPKARDLARIFFLPACPIERQADAFIQYQDGLPIDVEDVLKDSGNSPPAGRSERRPVAQTPPLRVYGGPIPEGERNSTLLSLAGGMRRRGMSEEAIAAALLEENEHRCQQPLDEKEVRGIAHSVMRYDPESTLFVFNLTDLGNAERLVTEVGGRARYVPAWDAWLLWADTRWRRDDANQMIQLAKLTIRKTFEEASHKPASDKTRDVLIRHTLWSEKESRLKSMVALAQTDPRIIVSHEVFDADPFSFNCMNGTLNLRTGVLNLHRREDMLTKLSPVVYDPAALCPIWDQFLHRIFAGNAELIAFVQRAVGYSLSGSTEEQVFFFLYGTGANGKTTFLEVIRAVLADYSQQAEFKSFLDQDREGARNDLAKLVGARFVAAAEAKASRYLDEGLIKQLTGNDVITTRFLFKEYFEYRPQFKIWLAANHKPQIRGTDNGIWRRVILIPFEVTIPKAQQDKKLIQKLLLELPGILRWAVQGCLDWQRAGGLNPPESVLFAIEEYRIEMDILAGFISERCVLDPQGETPFKALYLAYTSWCDENQHKPITQKTFAMRLTERGITKKHRRDGDLRVGIALRSQGGGSHLPSGERSDRSSEHSSHVAAIPSTLPEGPSEDSPDEIEVEGQADDEDEPF